MSHDIVYSIITFVGGIIGWLLKSLWNAVKELQEADEEIIQKVNAIEVLVAGEYVRRDELRHEFGKLFSMLESIDKKLDKKADK
jgi:Flp pilus assembly protein CpaB